MAWGDVVMSVEGDERVMPLMDKNLQGHFGKPAIGKMRR
jgi:hypothetical protein